MRVYIDMDDTLCDFMGAYNEQRIEGKKEWPQSEYGFFLNLRPLIGALSAVHIIHNAGLDPWILSAPSFYNPMSAAEKIQWVKEHFSEIGLHEKIILSPDKACVGTSQDYLVDDRLDSHGQDRFKGTFIHFTGNWNDVLEQLGI